MEIHVQLKRRHLVVLAVLVAAVVGSVAYASIPDGGGVYTACKLNATGTIRLIDPALGSSSLLGRCTALESKITWNKTGPSGVSPTVSQLASGDSNCPAGGASITDASGSTAYVCNGRSFSGSFQSPNGQYGLQVSDQGVALSGPGSSLTINGGTLGVAAANETDQVAVDRTQTIGGSDALTVGGSRSETVGAGQSVAVGGDRTEQVGGDASTTIGGNRTDTVGANETVTINGNREHKIFGNDKLSVRQDRTETAGGNRSLNVGGNNSEKISADDVHEVSGNFTLKGGGSGLIQAGTTLDLKAAFINEN